MDPSIACSLNVKTIAECILELVSNSLKANATSIAIRIYAGERKIQVIDNGTGMTRKKLKLIAEYNEQGCSNFWSTQNVYNSKGETLRNIRKLSDTMLITSKHYNSSKTYIKVFKVYQGSKIVKTQNRPSRGTTISIYGFHELSFNKWNIPLMYNLIASVALVNSKVSFSIRDDQQKKVIMIIGKRQNPIRIFKLLYDKETILRSTWRIKNVDEFNVKFVAYIGFTYKSNATQYIFLNNKLVHCPLIVELTSAIFINAFRYFTETYKRILRRKAVFILMFLSCINYVFAIENGRRILILPNIQELLQNIKKEILNIFVKNIAPISNSNNSIYDQRDGDLILDNLDNSKLLKRLAATDCRLHKVYNVKRKIIELRISQTRSIVRDEKLTRGKTDETRLITSKITRSVTPALQTNDINQKAVTPTLSEWSNWSYYSHESRALKIQNVSLLNNRQNDSLSVYKHLDFLPKKLHKQLRGNIKLTRTDILHELGKDISSEKLKFGLRIPDILLHQKIDVRPCKVVQRWREFRLKKECLQFVKIIGQMNNELIIGLMIRNNTKVLLLMDQHAIHERIRYENLLHRYKSEMMNYLLSVKLREPVAIELSAAKCNLLGSNKDILRKFGINFNVIGEGNVMVYTVPECLKKTRYYDEFKLKSNVETLLNEILENVSCEYYGANNLPPTIHEAIAAEACHGAIKFGDPLTSKQCKWLLKLLIKTRIPTRCAHGRPSIIPLLELTELEKRYTKLVKGKLNLNALKSYRKQV